MRAILLLSFLGCNSEQKFTSETTRGLTPPDVENTPTTPTATSTWEVTTPPPLGEDSGVTVKTPSKDTGYEISTDSTGSTGDTGSVPVESQWVKIVAGRETSLALHTSGLIYAWGLDPRPSLWPFPVGDYVDLASSGRHVCAVTSIGTGICIGNSNFGEVTPPLPPPGHTWVGVETGFLQTCWWDETGTPLCIGDPTRIPTNPSGDWVQADSEDEGMCWINSLGEASCAMWTGTSQDIITDVPTTLFSQVATASSDACGIAASDGHIECWGDRPEDQYNMVYTERIVENEPAGSFTDITVGSEFACALRDDGVVLCWGNTYETSGLTMRPCHRYGDPIINIPLTTFTQIDSGTCHICGITTSDTIECWGDDIYGQVSDIP